jgi:hypothetical protein
MADDDDNKDEANNLLVWEGTVNEGDRVYITVLVAEKDGTDYGPGAALIARTGTVIAAALAAGGGGEAAASSSTSGSELASFISSMNPSSLVEDACRTIGCLNSDDYPGAFLIGLRTSEGQVHLETFPSWRSRHAGPGTIVLTGDGSEYRARVSLQ